MLGVGIIVFFTVIAFAVDDPEVFACAAIGAIPFFIGIGLFIDAHLRRKDMEKHKASSPPKALRSIGRAVAGVLHPGNFTALSPKRGIGSEPDQVEERIR